MSSGSKRSGFTLIEILISTAIFVILCTIFIVDFVQQSDKDALKQSANGVVLDLQRMMTAAQSGQKNLGTLPHGYGFKISSITTENTKYVNFADTQISPTTPPVYGRWDAGETLNDRKLISPVIVTSLTSANIGYDTINFGFFIPGGQLTIYGSNGSVVTELTNPAIIKLYQPKRQLYSCIQVTPNGTGIINKITCP